MRSPLRNHENTITPSSTPLSSSRKRLETPMAPKSNHASKSMLFLTILIVGVSICVLVIMSSHQQLANVATQSIKPESDMPTPPNHQAQFDALQAQIASLQHALISHHSNTTMELRRELDALKQQQQSPVIRPETIIQQEQPQVQEINTQEQDVQSQVTPPSGKFAYAFVIGGCNTNDKRYRYYIFDIMINAKILREQGSTADIVVFFQMAYNVPHTKLLDDDHKMLEAMNIKYRYIPKNKHESFYHITLEKFRVLTLTEYDRVLFLDGDVVLRNKVDYLFEYSMKGILKPNVIFSGFDEPSNAGIFMVHPQPGDFELLQNVIDETETRGASLPYPHWDNYTGWGQKIEPPDYYEYISGRRGWTWTFYCSFSDQGLLLYYVKYVKKSMSVIMRGSVNNWGLSKEAVDKAVIDSGNATNIMHVEKSMPLSIFANASLAQPPYHCWIFQNRGRECVPPHSDIAHYTGGKKPWFRGPGPNISYTPETVRDDHEVFWFYQLKQIIERYGISKDVVDMDNWPKYNRPNLGMYPLHVSFATAVNERRTDIELKYNKTREMRALLKLRSFL